MPDPQPVALGDGTDGAWAALRGGNPFAPVSGAGVSSASNPPSGGFALHLAYPGWTAGDLTNGSGLLGVGAPFDNGAAAKAQADVDAFVNRGIAQRLQDSDTAAATRPSAPPSPGTSSGFLTPPTAATPIGAQIWNGFRKGDHDEFAGQFNGLAEAGKTLTTDPLGVANHLLELQSPTGQLQALWQAGQQAYHGALKLGQDYQTSAHRGILPYFFGDLAGHAAVKGAEAAVTEGVGGVFEVAPALDEGVYEFPDQLNGGIPYVGQTYNFPKRLSKHAAEGRHIPGTETLRPVTGGKTVREIAEHNRIQELTGGQKAKNSALVANKR